MPGRDIIILGGGGHASVIEDTLRAAGLPIAGHVAPESSDLLAAPYLGNDDRLSARGSGDCVLVNGIGMVGVSSVRRRVFERFAAEGFSFESVVHPDSSLSGSARLLAGVQILAGAVIGPYAEIGRDVIVNMSASVNHHCRIGDHAHIGPGAVLCGSVTVGAGGFIGAGATIIQGIQIGEGAFIAAGATVVRDVPAGARVAGVPARPL
jgi:sugar O-acyltransferase (sialic acid O-acetyltransferase NeuD family)